MKRLDGKITLVTGASEGLGFEISKAFAREGAVVVMIARTAAKLEASAASLRNEGYPTLPIPCDVGDTSQVQQAIETTLRTYGKLDVLLNNAAVAIAGDITAQSEEDWLYLLNINLLSVFRTIKFSLPSMLQRRSGSIINMASVQGDRSWQNWTTYAAAKGAMKAMTRQLAGQYGASGVRFNCISPGAMETPMNQRRREQEGIEFDEANFRLHAIPRMGRADEVNGAAIYLASDESSFVTGIDLLVDGGLSVLPRD